MENKIKRLSCVEANRIDMVSYLSRLGIDPARIRGVNYWYHSPLHNERTPSFKVNQRLNRWYDHGIGKGGNLVDFGILYHQCSVIEFLQILSGDFSFQTQNILLAGEAKPDSKITILTEKPLASPSLLQYFQERKIAFDIARQYCREVHYQVDEKKYFAIGFGNDEGGYELRSPFFKGSSSPKSATTICNGHDNVTVFEGFFDFLSYKTFFHGLEAHRPKEDFVILNSLAFFGKALPFMEQHNWIWLYLDRDKAGQNCSFCATSLNNKYRDSSHLYEGYKDFNEWLVNDGDGKLLESYRTQ